LKTGRVDQQTWSKFLPQKETNESEAQHTHCLHYLHVFFCCCLFLIHPKKNTYHQKRAEHGASSRLPHPSTQQQNLLNEMNRMGIGKKLFFARIRLHVIFRSGFDFLLEAFWRFPAPRVALLRVWGGLITAETAPKRKSRR
jgi:hypothetical protein